MSNAASSNVSRNRSSDRVRVVTCDDHPAIREALSDTINEEMDMEVTGQAATAAGAFAVLSETEPHVAVVDISLEDAHGLDLVQNLQAQYPDVEVVIFSMYDERVYAERAVRAGAAGYVMKAEPTKRVVEAIRTVRRGEVYLSRAMASRILSQVARAGGGGDQEGPGFALDDLTDREMEVFQMLGEGKGVEDIADQLNLSRKTVETYRRRAKEKLDLDSIAELLQHAIQWTHGQGAVRE
jgi:DNA-binding NarL/FixJ family response regulator